MTLYPKDMWLHVYTGGSAQDDGSAGGLNGGGGGEKKIHELNDADWSVIFQWIPSHCGIPGNKKANSLAKHGCNLPLPSVSLSCKQSISNISRPTLSSHDFLQQHLHRIGVEDTPDCPLCLCREAMNFVHLTVCASLANTGFNFSSDNFNAKAGLYWAARRKMAHSST
ncbi:uncharacterized protein TNCV_2119361 [Trichonephila clavipes]|nr:uncharacterized protein TNCV_2119361 [Trichonephila clavipes]